MASLSREPLKHSAAAPRRRPGRWARCVGFQIAFWRLCARRLREHDVLGMSAALCFRTIFTLIPILVLGLLVAKSLGTLEDSQRSLREFLEISGFAQIETVQDGTAAPAPPEATAAPTPASAAAPARRVINVADELEKIVAGVEGKLTFARVGPVGGALLIWTAVGLLATLEQALNRIFGAARSRSVARRLLLYWSVLTLGPVMLALASYLGRKALSLFDRVALLPWLLVALGRGGPIVVGVLVLAALYKLLPNASIRWRSAIAGAAVATGLWLLAKWGFAVYVERLVLSGNLYGVLGVLPLFLLWLYYTWLILLFGAELVHTASDLGQVRGVTREQRSLLGPTDVLAAAVAISQAYEAGCGPVALDQLAARLRLPALHVRTLVDQLVAAGFVCPTEDRTAPHYVPARPAAKLPLLALLDLDDSRSRSSAAAEYEPELAAAVARVQSQLRAALTGVTLRDALQAEHAQ